MEKQQLGKIIKELRQQLGLSQAELAEGICSQAQISKLETGDEYPYSNTLYEISKKLGVDMNYFFHKMDSPNLDYVEEVKNIIRKFIRNRDYVSISYIIKKEKSSQLFQTTLNKQFLLWHEAICIYYLENNKDLAIQLLKEALELTKMKDQFLKENEIEIYLSMAVIHDDENKLDNALDIYYEALNKINQLPQRKNYKLKLRVFYGLSRVLVQMERFEEGLEYARKGVSLCLNKETLYLLGEHLFMVGYCLSKLDKKQDSTPYFKDSIHIFNLEKKIQMSDLVKEEMKEQQVKI
ncbi:MULTISPECIES: helix-turn-helix domain-containing protein [Bacillus]|uniref:helix-turn-helix domain-containing protein n=1 Tax=Bacillus TaxID=1386 RepID=UPI0002E203B8|nr:MULTISPECIES: helix-turn-helix domain-containing protein [Bacillus]